MVKTTIPKNFIMYLKNVFRYSPKKSSCFYGKFIMFTFWLILYPLFMEMLLEINFLNDQVKGETYFKNLNYFQNKKYFKIRSVSENVQSSKMVNNFFKKEQFLPVNRKLIPEQKCRWTENAAEQKIMVNKKCLWTKN